MQMTLTITAESPSELVTVLTALQGAGVSAPLMLKARSKSPEEEVEETLPADGGLETPDRSVPPMRRGRPPKAKAEEPAPKLKVVPKDEAATEDAEPEREITLLDVRRALTEYLAANSETDAAALLAKYGHTDRLSQLDPAHYAALYKAAVTPPEKKTNPLFDDDISDVGA